MSKKKVENPWDKKEIKCLCGEEGNKEFDAIVPVELNCPASEALYHLIYDPIYTLIRKGTSEISRTNGIYILIGYLKALIPRVRELEREVERLKKQGKKGKR